MKQEQNDLRNWMIRIYEDARKVILLNQEVLPSFYARTGKAIPVTYFTPWTDELSRDQLLRTLAFLFAARRVDSYVSLSEGWEIVDGQDPCEALMVIGVSRNGVLTARTQLGVDKDNNRTCGPLEWLDLKGGGGPVVELLPNPDVPGTSERACRELEQLIGMPSQQPTLH